MLANPQIKETRRCLRIGDVTFTYGISRSSVYKLIAQGKLKAVKLGGRRLIPVDSLEALLADAA